MITRVVLWINTRYGVSLKVLMNLMVAVDMTIMLVLLHIPEADSVILLNSLHIPVSKDATFWIFLGYLCTLGLLSTFWISECRYYRDGNNSFIVRDTSENYFLPKLFSGACYYSTMSEWYLILMWLFLLASSYNLFIAFWTSFFNRSSQSLDPDELT